MSKVYRVSLPLLSAQEISLKSSDDEQVRPVVYVDAARFVEVWENSIGTLLIPRYEEWDTATKIGIEHYLTDNSSGIASLPMVNCEIRSYVETKMFGFLKKRETKLYIGFLNGRHRTMFMLAKGAEQIPVQCTNVEAAAILKSVFDSN